MAISPTRRGYAGSGTAGRYALARVVDLATAIAVGLIVAGIILHLVGANARNDIVSAVHDAAVWLTTPFHGLFSVHGDWRYILNWGLAALVYLIVGRLIARLLSR